jgi:hypothetical protein
MHPNKPWFQKPKSKRITELYNKELYVAKQYVELGTSKTGNFTLQVKPKKMKIKGKKRRFSGACLEHRRRHQRCSLDCEGRKKGNKEIKIVLETKEDEIANLDMQLLVQKFLKFGQ